MDKQEGLRGAGVGLATIIVLFVSIALTVFAALAASTAAQEAKVAARYAAAVSDYWAADAACAAVANELGALHAAGADEDALRARAEALGAVCEAAEGGLAVSFSAPAGAHNELQCRVLLGARFELLFWRLVNVDGDWSPDLTIPVYTGE